MVPGWQSWSLVPAPALPFTPSSQTVPGDPLRIETGCGRHTRKGLNKWFFSPISPRVTVSLLIQKGI